MGGERSKVLMELGGRYIVERAVGSLLACGLIERVIVATRQESIAEVRACLAGIQSLEVVAGGASRQLSVRAALSRLADEPSDYVLVHDAARCLVTPELARRCIEAAFEHRAVTAAIACVDSLKLVADGGVVERSLERAGVWLVQTPQVFAMELLVAAHQDAPQAATDDASLVERIHPVRVVRGESTNLKVTTPPDLELAGAILRLREGAR